MSRNQVNNPDDLRKTVKNGEKYRECEVCTEKIKEKKLTKKL